MKNKVKLILWNPYFKWTCINTRTSCTNRIFWRYKNVPISGCFGDFEILTWDFRRRLFFKIFGLSCICGNSSHRIWQSCRNIGSRGWGHWPGTKLIWSIAISGHFWSIFFKKPDHVCCCFEIFGRNELAAHAQIVLPSCHCLTCSAKPKHSGAKI